MESRSGSGEAGYRLPVPWSSPLQLSSMHAPSAISWLISAPMHCPPPSGEKVWRRPSWNPSKAPATHYNDSKSRWFTYDLGAVHKYLCMIESPFGLIATSGFSFLTGWHLDCSHISTLCPCSDLKCGYFSFTFKLYINHILNVMMR